MNEDSVGLLGPFGDRQGTHTVSLGMPDGSEAHGILELKPSAAPSLMLRPPGRPYDRALGSFPRRYCAPLMFGRVSFTSGQVIVGRAVIIDLESQLNVEGQWAVIGHDLSLAAGDGLWDEIKLCASGFELLLGNAILASSNSESADSSPRYQIERNPGARFESQSGGFIVEASYGYESRPSPSSFSVVAEPLLSVTAPEPIAINQWLADWVDPFMALLGVATGKVERALRLVVSRRYEDPAFGQTEVSGQLFANGIHQEAGDEVARSPLTSGLFTLGGAPPLASLLTAGQDASLQTTSSLYHLALAPSLPARVRYLLFIQALEGLDTARKATAECTEDLDHQQRYKAVIDELQKPNVLDSETLGFIKEHLSKKPKRSLGGRLNRLLNEFPFLRAHIDPWTEATNNLELAIQREDPETRASVSLADRLARARNILSHGGDLDSPALDPAVKIAGTMLRFLILKQLGFQPAELALG